MIKISFKQNVIIIDANNRSLRIKTAFVRAVSSTVSYHQVVYKNKMAKALPAATTY